MALLPGARKVRQGSEAGGTPQVAVLVLWPCFPSGCLLCGCWLLPTPTAIMRFVNEHCYVLGIASLP